MAALGESHHRGSHTVAAGPRGRVPQDKCAIRNRVLFGAQLCDRLEAHRFALLERCAGPAAQVVVQQHKALLHVALLLQLQSANLIDAFDCAIFCSLRSASALTHRGEDMADFGAVIVVVDDEVQDPEILQKAGKDMSATGE
jgi:hypothetical protein